MMILCNFAKYQTKLLWNSLTLLGIYEKDDYKSSYKKFLLPTYGGLMGEVEMTQQEMHDVALNYTSYYSTHEEEIRSRIETDGVYNLTSEYNTDQIQTALYDFYEKFTYVTATYVGPSNTYSPAYTLRTTIAKWYVIIRNIAIVCMLSILVYTGIRILIFSTSQDKAKYKQLLIDWLVAVCLLFFMHYIMNFSVKLVKRITALISFIDLNDFINIARNHAELNDNVATCWGYTIIYLVLIFFSIKFTFIYLKRVIYMAFLTMIAPLVALTYPIDKLNDGKAQAFDSWLREYLFTLLMQPFHLLLYTIIIGSAADLATGNLLFSIVALAFISEAENFLRKFFGFEKAQTPGLLGGPAGAALMMSAIRSLEGLTRGSHGKPKAQNGSDKKAEIGNKNENPKKPYFNNNMNAIETLKNDKPASKYGPADTTPMLNIGEEINEPTDTTHMLDIGEEIDEPTDITHMLDIDEDTETPRVSYDHSDKENGYTEEEYQNIVGELLADGFTREEASEQLIGNGWDEAEANQLLNDVYGNENDDNLNYAYDAVTLDDLNDVYGDKNDDSFASIPFIGNEAYDVATIDDLNDTNSSQNSAIQNSTPTVSTTPQNTSSITEKPKKRRLKGVASVAKLGGKTFANRLASVAKSTGRKATQIAAGALVGGALGTIGLAAGIASGDPNKIFQNATLAATQGYRIGKTTRDRIVSNYEGVGVHGDGFKNIKDTYRKNSLSKDDYLAKRQQEYIDNYIKEHTEEFAKKNNIGKRQAKETLEEFAPDCIRNGIDDIDDINNIYDIKQKREEWQRQRDAGENVSDTPPITQEIAMAATKLRNEYNINPSGMTKKTRQELNDTGITDEMLDVIKQVNTNKKQLE